MKNTCRVCAAQFETVPHRPKDVCKECWKPIHAAQVKAYRDRKDAKVLKRAIRRLRKKVIVIAIMANAYTEKIKEAQRQQKRLHMKSMFPCERGATDTLDAVRRISEGAGR